MLQSLIIYNVIVDSFCFIWNWAFFYFTPALKRFFFFYNDVYINL